MRCFVVIFILCFIRRFTDGQYLLEGRADDSDNNDIVVLEEKVNDSGDGTNDATFRGDEEDDDEKDEKDVTQAKDSSLEANTEAPQSDEEGKGAVLEKDKKVFTDTVQRYASEMAAGDNHDLIGQNIHIKQSNAYNDLGRRFVPQYQYTGPSKAAAAEHNEDLVPEKAPPELVLVVAKESALLGPDKDVDNDLDQKKILRSGDYWDGVWKEEIAPKSALRSGTEKNTEKKVLGSIKAKVKPGTEFYKVVSRMKKISPRLLYIINKKQL
nr:uncharacterized protein LOC110377999 [Helicoverpa armigera]